MGTNFYHRRRKGFLGLFGVTEEKHIGKRSRGWEFSFRGYIERRDMGMSKTIVIGSWQDWKRILKRGRIYDEYGKRWSYQDFVKMVEDSREPDTKQLGNVAYPLNHYDEAELGYRSYCNIIDSKNWKDSEGWSFSLTEFC